MEIGFKNTVSATVLPCQISLWKKPCSSKNALQWISHLFIPFLGIARPQSKFPHSCACEQFIYSQDRSTYSCRRIGRSILWIYKSLTDTWMWKWELRPRNSFSGKICFEFLVLVLCGVEYLSKKNSGTAPSVNLSHKSRARDRVFAWTCNTEGTSCALKETAHRKWWTNSTS